MATSDGARNVFQIDIVSGRTDTLTHFAQGRHLTLPANIQGHQVALELRSEPPGVRAYAYLLPDTAPVTSVLLPEGTVVRGFTGRSWLLAHATATAPTDFRLLKVEIQGGSTAITTTPLPQDPIVPQACAVDTASYVTHDGRLVHALLRSPVRPLPNPADRLAIVWAYYGGANQYEELASLWCEAGIASLSPDIDRDTNGDRGGKEVADVLFAARWLRDRLGLHERQVGVYGMSQGGYNAMRALTFQPETDGINVSFNFGFGIAQAGYSSMLTILHHTNTQSPSIIATGDPDTERGRARLRERSPLDQVGRLSAPLLLIHGTNDHRVQIEESRQMLAAARAAHKDVKLVELPGEGHGVSIFSNLMPYYAAQISFLERVRANQRR
jgi:dipeptidyl aminopeptidase/acylaminoacyl peptidase